MTQSRSGCWARRASSSSRKKQSRSLADAEEDVPVPCREVRLAAGEREDRHHARDAAAAGDADDVLGDTRAEGGVTKRREEADARALDALAEEPVAHRAGRLLLHHERQALGARDRSSPWSRPGRRGCPAPSAARTGPRRSRSPRRGERRRPPRRASGAGRPARHRRGRAAPGISVSPDFSTLTSSAQSSCATLWHVRNSPSLLTYLWPGASGQWVSCRPLTSFALHVPHVPVAHSYGQLHTAPQRGVEDLLPGRRTRSGACHSSR